MAGGRLDVVWANPPRLPRLPCAPIPDDPGHPQALCLLGLGGVGELRAQGFYQGLGRFKEFRV